MNSEILDIIVNEYEKQRSYNKNERDNRVEQIYLKFPEIKEIDDQINKTGRDTLRDILSNPDKKNLKEEMKIKFEELNKRKKDLIKKYNIPQDYDSIKYKCPLCEDTGHIEGKGRCNCFKQKVINILYEQSNMSELMKKQNFETFDFSYFSKKKIAGYKLSPYENISVIKSFCEDYAYNFEKAEKNLLFSGDTGVGKTFMSSCIGKAIIEQGKTVIYIRASKLFKLFEDERFGRIANGMNDLYNCDLLIIDDLGTEAFSKNNNSYLLELINERIINNRKIIINTNLGFSNIEEMYSKRLSSRILEDFNVMYFYGEDIRKIKLFKNKRSE